MSVLRRGYVPVEPDTSGFDTKLQEQFRKQDPGGKAGKQLGGQLNRALKRINLDPIDVKADPRTALANIAATEQRLRDLAGNAATVELKVQTERALTQLGRFRKQLGEVGASPGEEAAKGFVTRFAARIGPLMASGPVTSPMAIAGGLLGAAMTPTLAAGIAGAVVGGAGLGGVLGGLALARRDPRVKQASDDLGDFVLGDLTQRASGFVEPTLGAITRIRQGFGEMGPDLDKIFRSSRFVEPLTDAGIKGAKGFLSGFAEAVDKSDPVMEAVRNNIVGIGTAAGDVFRTLAQDAEEGASAIDDVTLALTNMITVAGQLIHAGAVIKGYTDELDKAVDKGRYWIEDNAKVNESLELLGLQVDLTADGFAVGTVQAEAYRKATLGTATANDFAVLKQAGMTEAQIAAADASGRYRSELERVRAETVQAATANGTLVATEEDVTAAQQALTQAQRDYTHTLDTMGPAAGRATTLVDGLRRATQNLHGTQISAMEANEAYEASWDQLSDAVKRNKTSLDIHTTAGRANRDALQALLSKSNEMYLADIQAGVGIDTARRKHETRTDRIREEARQLGLNRTATQNLITVYGKIPGRKETDLVLDGEQAVQAALENLYIYQRSLAEGAPIGQVRARINKDQERNRKRQYATGGWTGPGHTHQPAGIVHADEFVIQKASRRQIEQQHPGLLDEMNATGQVPAGYAAGGLVVPVDTSRRWPFETDVSGTRIPSRAQVAANVMPAFGNWPPSPGAQRGDSGVWRSVLQLIRSTGPLSGSFGNAYRPGDPKWHGSGRAVDWMGYNQDALARFLAARRPLELIHRTKNRDYAYTRGRNKGSFNSALMEAHRNHIHIAMDDGGVRMLQPGMNLIPNGTGRPEPIAGPNAMAAMAGNTYNITVNVPVGAHPAETGRQVVETIKAYERTNGTRWRTGP